MSKWPIVTLGDLCSTASGGTPSRSNPSNFVGSIPWIKSGELRDGNIIQATEYISEEALKKSSAKMVKAGTLLIAMYGATVGRLGILNIDATTNQAVCAISPGPNLDRDYLFYQLMSKRDFLISKSHGGAQPNISQGMIKGIEIPLPPLEEQQRIVALLDRAADIRRRAEEAREKARSIIPALFVDMFGDTATNPMGWDVVELGEVLESAQYGTSQKANEAGQGVPVIRMGNVTTSGDLNTTNLKHIVLEGKEYENAELLEGDIMFNRTNSKELVGKTGIWDGRFEAVAASYFIRLRVNRAFVTPEYVWCFMNTPHMKKILFNTARGAIGQSNINAKELRAFKLPLPSKELQDRFAADLQTIKSLTERCSKGLETATSTQTALSAELFA